MADIGAYEYQNIKYVDTNSIGGTASDSNPGTISLPWKTLTHALSNINKGEILNIRGGKYIEYTNSNNHEYGTVSVNISNYLQEKPTQESERITIRAYNGEEVVVSSLVPSTELGTWVRVGVTNKWYMQLDTSLISEYQENPHRYVVNLSQDGIPLKLKPDFDSAGGDADLTEAGEWTRDSDLKVYVWCRNNEDPNTANIEIYYHPSDSIDSNATFSVWHDNSNWGYLTFSGITFEGGYYAFSSGRTLSAPYYVIKNLILSNCTFRNTYSDALKLVDDDAEVKDCDIYYFGESGIDLCRAKRAKIKRNKIHDSVDTRITPYTNGIMAKGGWYTDINENQAIIEKNIIYNLSNVAFGAISIGGDSDPETSFEGLNIIVRNNIIYNIHGIYIILVVSTKNCKFVNNLLYNCTLNKDYGTYGLITLDANAHNWEKNDDFVVENNIINNCDNEVLKIQSGTYSGFVFNYNCVSSSSLYYYNGSQHSLAQSINDGYNINSITGSPKFININNNDFRPTTDSPVIQSGTPNNDTYLDNLVDDDFEYTSRKNEPNLDIGPYQIRTVVDNLILNHSFEEYSVGDIDDSPVWNNPTGNSNDYNKTSIVIEDGLKVLKMHGTKYPTDEHVWHYLDQILDPDVYKFIAPGKTFKVSCRFKTTQNMRAWIYLRCTGNFRDIDGGIVGNEGTGVARYFTGNNEWQYMSFTYAIPYVDKANNCMAEVPWFLSLIRDGIDLYDDPIYFDDIYIEEVFESSNPIGNVNDENTISVDFGDINEYSGSEPANIIFEDNNLSEIYTDNSIACFGKNVKYRIIQENTTTDINIPVNNGVANIGIDANGLPTSPLILEIVFKDNIPYDQVAKILSNTGLKSVDDNGNADGLYDGWWYESQTTNYSDKEEYNISLIGQNYLSYIAPKIREVQDTYGTWKHFQVAVPVTKFQTLRAIDGYFKLQIKTADSPIYISSISLKQVTEEECSKVSNNRRNYFGFYFTESPFDEPAIPVSYNNPDAQIFVRDNERIIYRDTKPQQSECINAIYVNTVKGEVEAFSFGVYSESGTGSYPLTFQFASDFIGDSPYSVIDSSLVEMYEVIYVDRRLNGHNFEDTYFKSYGNVPDHLLPLTSLSIDAETSKRVWLNLRLPDDIESDLYIGTLNVIKNSVIIDTITISIYVQPFSLDNVDVSTIYQDPLAAVRTAKSSNMWKEYRDLHINPIIWSWMKDIRCTSVSPLTFDTSLFESKIQSYIDNGVISDGRLIVCFGHMANGIYRLMYSGSEMDSDGSNLWSRLSNQAFINNCEQLLDAYLSVIESKGNFSVYFTAVDEPLTYPIQRIKADRLNRIVQGKGYKVYQTFYEPIDGQPLTVPSSYNVPDIGYGENTIPPETDLVDCKVHGENDLVNGFNIFNNDPYKSGKEWGSYQATQIYKYPLYTRFFMGVESYALGSSMNSMWAFQDISGNVFDDFEAKTNMYPCFTLGYPSYEGIFIKAMPYEGFREGIKDYRILKTLENYVNLYPALQASLNAKEFLDYIKDYFQNNISSIQDMKLTNCDSYGYHKALLSKVSAVSQSDEYSVVPEDDFESFNRIREKALSYINEIQSQNINPFTWFCYEIIPMEWYRQMSSPWDMYDGPTIVENNLAPYSFVWNAHGIKRVINEGFDHHNYRPLEYIVNNTSKKLLVYTNPIVTFPDPAPSNPYEMTLPWIREYGDDIYTNREQWLVQTTDEVNGVQIDGTGPYYCWTGGDKNNPQYLLNYGNTEFKAWAIQRYLEIVEDFSGLAWDNFTPWVAGSFWFNDNKYYYPNNTKRELLYHDFIEFTREVRDAMHSVGKVLYANLYCGPDDSYDDYLSSPWAYRWEDFINSVDACMFEGDADLKITNNIDSYHPNYSWDHIVSMAQKVYDEGKIYLRWLSPQSIPDVDTLQYNYCTFLLQAIPERSFLYSTWQDENHHMIDLPDVGTPLNNMYQVGDVYHRNFSKLDISVNPTDGTYSITDPSVNANTFYVSEDGDDNNHGTTSLSPWKTIDKVNEAISNNIIQPGSTVYFKCEDTFIGSIDLSSISNPYGEPIKLTSYGIENPSSSQKPVITGKISLDDSWINIGENIWRYDVSSIPSSKIRYLLLNGVNQQMAQSDVRYCDTDPYGEMSSFTDSDLIQEYTENDVFVGSEVLMRNQSYLWTIRGVSEYDSSSGTISYTPDTSLSGSLEIHKGSSVGGYFLQNSLYILQDNATQNEWANLDNTENSGDCIYYYSTVNPFTLGNIEVSSEDILINIEDTSYAHVNNLKFTYANYYAIFTGNSDSMKITNCEFERCSMGISEKNKNSSNSVIDNNVFINIASVAIQQYNPVNLTVSNNNITNVGLEIGRMPYEGGYTNGEYEAINMWYTAIHCPKANGCLFEYNNLENIGGCGFNLSFVSNHVLVQYNYVRNCSLILVDSGPFYSYSETQNEITSNVNQITYRNNISIYDSNNSQEYLKGYVGASHGWLTNGLYKDGLIRATNWYNNFTVGYKVALMVNPSKYGEFKNNIAINNYYQTSECPAFSISDIYYESSNYWARSENNIFENNIFIQNSSTYGWVCYLNREQLSSASGNFFDYNKYLNPLSTNPTYLFYDKDGPNNLDFYNIDLWKGQDATGKHETSNLFMFSQSGLIDKSKFVWYATNPTKGTVDVEFEPGYRYYTVDGDIVTNDTLGKYEGKVYYRTIDKGMPQVSNIIINFNGNTLTASYTYSHENGNTESGSTYQWYRSDDETDLARVPISGANSLSYTKTIEDNGKSIIFGVIPKSNAGNGSLITGVERFSNSMKVVVISSLERYLQTDINIIGSSSANIKLGKNETRAFQFVIINYNGYIDLKNVHIEFLGFSSNNSPSLTLYREHYIEVIENSYSSNYAHHNPPMPIGLYPDALVPFINPYTNQEITDSVYLAQNISIEPLKSQAYWVDVFAGEDVISGKYNSEITITYNDLYTISIPVEIEILNFTVNSDTKFKKQFEGVREKEREQFNSMNNGSGPTDNEWDQIKLKYYRLLAEHNMPVQTPLWPAYLIGETAEDFWTLNTPFDYVERAYDWFINAKSDVCYFYIVWGGVGEKVNEEWVNYFNINNSWTKEKFDQQAIYRRKYLQACEELVNMTSPYDASWIKNPYFYIDEPNSVEEYMGIIEWAKEVKIYSPSFKIMVSEQPDNNLPNKPGYPSLIGYVDIWVPIFDYIWTPSDPSIENIQKRINNGDEVWSYTALYPSSPYYNNQEYLNLNNGIWKVGTASWSLDSPLVHYLAPVWISYNLGITGLLYWSQTYQGEEIEDSNYNRNPWENAITYITEEINKYNKEGNMFYPGFDAGVPECFIPSIRAKILRDAMFDYKYFEMMENIVGESTVKELVSSVANNYITYSQNISDYLNVRSLMQNYLDNSYSDDRVTIKTNDNRVVFNNLNIKTKYRLNPIVRSSTEIVLNNVGFIVCEVNNSLVWDFGGSNEHTFTSINEYIYKTVGLFTYKITYDGEGSYLFSIELLPVSINDFNYIVVYRMDDADSFEFSNYYANSHNFETTNGEYDIPIEDMLGTWEVKGQQIGIACSNLEILPDEQSFINEVVSPLQGAILSIISQRYIAGIILGYNIPGGFYADDYEYTGNIISSTSYLSRVCICDEYGTFLPFELKSPNMLYNRSVYKEFDSIDAQSSLVVSRIDAPSLNMAKQMVLNADNLNKKRFIDGTLYIDPYSDKMGVLADNYTSLLVNFRDYFAPNLNLNIWSTAQTDPYIDSVIPFVQNDSFVWSWFSDVVYPSFFQISSNRAFLYNADFSGAFTLRDENSKTWPIRALYAGYPCVAGSLSNPGYDGFLNPNAFFKALLNRATIGEAYLYSLPYLNWTTTLVGDPLVSIAFPDAITVEEEVLSNDDSWLKMSKDLARTAAYIYRKKEDIYNLRNATCNIQDINLELKLLPIAQQYYVNNGDRSRISQLTQLTQYLFDYIVRMYRHSGLPMEFPTINDYLTIKQFKISDLLVEVNSSATIDTNNILPEGWWEFGFTVQNDATAFVNYYFRLNLYSDEAMTNLIRSIDSGSSILGWSYESQKGQFENMPSFGLPASYIGREVKYTVRSESEYLTRGDIVYFKVIQYDDSNLSGYTARSYKDIIYT